MADQLPRQSGKKVVVIDSGIEKSSGARHTSGNADTMTPLQRHLTKDLLLKHHGANRDRTFLLSREHVDSGAATNCWGGWIRPLDSHDFTRWPVNIESDLKKWYPTVLEYLGLDRGKL